MGAVAADRQRVLAWPCWKTRCRSSRFWHFWSSRTQSPATRHRQRGRQTTHQPGRAACAQRARCRAVGPAGLGGWQVHPRWSLEGSLQHRASGGWSCCRRWAWSCCHGCGAAAALRARRQRGKRAREDHRAENSCAGYASQTVM
jgi:hypothetical protein